MVCVCAVSGAVRCDRRVRVICLWKKRGLNRSGDCSRGFRLSIRVGEDLELGRVSLYNEKIRGVLFFCGGRET